VEFLGISGIATLSDATRRQEGKTYLGEVQTGTISTVIVIPVHMEDFLSVYREETGQDAFSETGSLRVSCATETGMWC
jgi:hypothetical protein